MKLAIYARYSSDLQNQKSVDDQIDYCQRWINKTLEGVAVVRSFSDKALSGCDMNRPGLDQMMEAIRQGEIDLVVVEALDRLTRNGGDAYTLYQVFGYHNVCLWSVNEGEVSELLVGLKGTMNAMYISDMAAKVRRGHKARAAAGHFPAGRAYGYRIKRDAVDEHGRHCRGVREIDEDQARIVRRIFRMYVEGHSARQIALQLNAEGIASPSGRGWSSASILGTRHRETGILCNALYNGQLIYNRTRLKVNPLTRTKKYVPNPPTEWVLHPMPHLRIVDEPLWNAARARRLKVAPPVTRSVPRDPDLTHRSSRRPLTGLVYCGACGGMMSLADRQRYVCSQYRRRLGECSNARSRTVWQIAERIFEALERRIAEVTDWSAVLREIHEAEREEANEAGRQIEELGEEIERLLDALRAGVDVPEIHDRIKARHQQRAVLQTQLDRSYPAIGTHEEIVLTFRAALELLECQLRAGVDYGAGWKQMLSLLIERVTLSPLPDKPRGMSTQVTIRDLTGWSEFLRQLLLRDSRVGAGGDLAGD